MATFVAVSSRVSGFPPSNPRRIVFGLLTVGGSDGASAGDIPASLFGLSVVEDISPAVKSDSSLIVVMAPAYSATNVATSVLGKAAATAAAADIPSGTYAVTVKGY